MDPSGAVVAIQARDDGDLAQVVATKVERKGWILNIF